MRALRGGILSQIPLINQWVTSPPVKSLHPSFTRNTLHRKNMNKFKYLEDWKCLLCRYETGAFQR